MHCKATRWRFAFPTPDEDEPGRENGREEKKTTKKKAAKEREPARVNSAPYVFDPSLMLGACGDWASGPGVGDAYESGAALGAAVAKRFAVSRAADEEA